MSGPQKVSQARERVNQFFLRHAKRAWTAVFNGQLEAQIHDASLCLELRAAAWIERYSWGNNADSVCDANGIVLTQSDFARLVGLDRRAVSPVFIKLRRSGLITTVGQEIFPVDDPGFASSSPDVEGSPTMFEDSAKGPTFRAFIEEIVARDYPDKFKAYQERGQLWKEIRTDLLHLYDDYVDRMSESLPTNEPARPEAPGQTVGEPPDASGEANRHSAAASLLLHNQTHISGSSSSFSSVKEAFNAYAKTDDDDLVKQLCGHTRKPTQAELIDLIHTKGPLLPRSARNRAAYLAAAVVKAIESEDFYERRKHVDPPPEPAYAEPSVEELLATYEAWIKAMPNHPEAELVRERIKDLKQRKPADNESHTKSKKAGQA